MATPEDTLPIDDALRELHETLSLLASYGGECGAELARVEDLRERMAARVRLAPDVLVVALAGTTGAGKSSLYNALTGSTHATVGVRRPTTHSPAAAIMPEAATGAHTGQLLDWLEVADRFTVTKAPYPLGPVVLIDLPDIDSLSQSNRRTADRLLESVDVVLWVVDPEKYADSRLHQTYLAPRVAHGAVMDVVLNQLDRLSESDQQLATADLRQRLRNAGLASRVYPASVHTGAGLENLAENLRARAEAKLDQIARLNADAHALAVALSDSNPAPTGAPGDWKRRLAQFEEEVASTAGIGGFAAARGAEYKHALLRATAWPPLRVWHRSRRFPPSPELTTTYLPDPVARLSAGFTGPGAWQHTLRATAIHAADELRQKLRTITPTVPEAAPPRWTRVLGPAQWLGLLVLLAGLVVFGVEVGIRYFGVTLPPALEGVPAAPGYPALPPVPWSLVTAGLGVVLALLVGAVALAARAVAVRRHRRRVRSQITHQVRDLVEETVTGKLLMIIAAGQRYREALTNITRPAATRTSRKVRGTRKQP